LSIKSAKLDTTESSEQEILLTLSQSNTTHEHLRTVTGGHILVAPERIEQEQDCGGKSHAIREESHLVTTAERSVEGSFTATAARRGSGASKAAFFAQQQQHIHTVSTSHHNSDDDKDAAEEARGDDEAAGRDARNGESNADGKSAK